MNVQQVLEEILADNESGDDDFTLEDEENDSLMIGLLMPVEVKKIFN